MNVEHEEVVLIPRWVQCERVTFKYGLGEEFIAVLRTLHKLGLDSTEPVSVRGAQVAPRDVVAAALPDPATLGERMSGRTCAGTWVTGVRQGRRAALDLPVPRGRQRVHDAGVRQPGRRVADRGQPVVALELLDQGIWKGAGVLGPEAFPPAPFLERLAELGSPHGQRELRRSASRVSRGRSEGE